MAQDLELIIKESGLDKTKSQVLLDNFRDYFQIAAEWESKAKTIVVKSADQKADMEMARVGRLFLREKRIAVEKKRKELKEQSLREGKAIDGLANVLKAAIVPIEEYLDKQEHFVEIQEEMKREALRAEMERKDEEERLRQEAIQKLHQERKEVLLPYFQWWEPELKETNLGEITQENFNNILSSLKREKSDYDKEQEKIRQDNLRLQKEAEEKERKAREEREAHERQLAEERAKADKEKEKQAEKLLKEREKAEKKRKEIEAKAKEEQERIRKESEAKADAERIEKERLRKILENQVECPNCHHKFQLQKKA